MKRTISLILILGAVFFITASSCFAQVINGCVGKNGQLSIVSDPAQCKGNETPISWNGIGPQGPQGPQGPAGVANGIRAAVWGEYTLGGPSNCSVGFFRGADNIVGTPGTNDGECRLTITLPADQPQSWGTAYACYMSNGTNTALDTTCRFGTNFDVNGKPVPVIQCTSIGGTVQIARINFLCIN
jgi:hypothetical protein